MHYNGDGEVFQRANCVSLTIKYIVNQKVSM